MGVDLRLAVKGGSDALVTRNRHPRCEYRSGLVSRWTGARWNYADILASTDRRFLGRTGHRSRGNCVLLMRERQEVVSLSVVPNAGARTPISRDLVGGDGAAHSLPF